jgi:GGDEF domain-containing protein
LAFEARPGVPLPLSISAGAAVFPHDGDSYESLLATADSRMYGDKSVRKNDPTRQLGAGQASYDLAVTPHHSTRPN